jgi:hypothetical protein
VTQVGSSYATAKRAFLDLLRSRPALGEVAIRYEAPLDPVAVVGPTGKHECIFYTDDEADEGVQENVVICGLPLQVDETYRLPLVVQVVVPETTDGVTSTQEDADRRVDEILGEVFGAMTNFPAMAPGVDEPFPYMHMTRANFVRRTGVVGDAEGHGSSCLARLEVEARIALAGES